jgi:hypothetical protein
VGRLTVSIRERDLISFSTHTAKDSVHEGDHVFGTMGFTLIHSFIDCSGIGDPVQKKDLVKGKTKNV